MAQPFPAHVLADFDAELPVELSVQAGDFVLVLPDAVPQGWCKVRAGRGGQSEEGLVPWYYIVSAAHAELEAATAHLHESDDDDYDLSTDGPPPAPGKAAAAVAAARLGPAATPPPGQAPGGEYLEAIAMRGQTGLGIDLDNSNVVRRLSPGSMAAQQGLLRVGDTILEVDGVHLNGGVALGGKSVPQVMATGQPSYKFRVYRPPEAAVDVAALSADIMSTQRLQAIVDGLTLPRGASAQTSYVSHAGRQVNADQRSRARAAQRSHVRPTHVDELRAWSVAELQATLRRQVNAGAVNAQSAKALARPGHGPGSAPPSPQGGLAGLMRDVEEEDDDLFGQIDKVVQEQSTSVKKGAGASPAQAALPPGEASGLKAIAGEAPELDTVVVVPAAGGGGAGGLKRRGSGVTLTRAEADLATAEVERTVHATMHGGTLPAWVFADYVEKSRRAPGSVETAQLERPKAQAGNRPKGQLRPRGRVYGEVEEISELSSGGVSSSNGANVATTAAVSRPASAPAPEPVSAPDTPSKKSGGWFGRKAKTPTKTSAAPALVAVDAPQPRSYALVPEGGAAPVEKKKWAPPKAAEGARPAEAVRLVTGGGLVSKQDSPRESRGARRSLLVLISQCVPMLGGWVNPHREQQTIPQGQTSSPPNTERLASTHIHTSFQH